MNDCAACNGTGKRSALSFANPKRTIVKTCYLCRGTGKLDSDRLAAAERRAEEAERKLARVRERVRVLADRAREEGWQVFAAGLSALLDDAEKPGP